MATAGRRGSLRRQLLLRRLLGIQRQQYRDLNSIQIQHTEALHLLCSQARQEGSGSILREDNQNIQKTLLRDNHERQDNLVYRRYRLLLENHCDLCWNCPSACLYLLVRDSLHRCHHCLDLDHTDLGVFDRRRSLCLPIVERVRRGP